MNSPNNTYIAQIKAAKVSLTIFCGNLPLTWQQQDLLKLLQPFGNILEIRLALKNNKFSGIAYVKFQSMTCAEAAIQQLNGKPFHNKVVILKWLDTQQNRLGITQGGDHRLFVASLPRQATDRDLYEIFSHVGEVESIRLQQKQFWAFVDYKHKESALLAIKFLNGQVCLHGSHIPIDVRFKQKRYNSFMAKKHEKEELDPFELFRENIFYEVMMEDRLCYFHPSSKSFLTNLPSERSRICRLNREQWYTIQQKVKDLNDFSSIGSKKSGPVGANLFLFHLPNNVKQSEIYKIFSQFGNIVSVRIMTEKTGKSKGIGFVSYDSVESANTAIAQMNGYQLMGKRLKVQLNKKDQQTLGVSNTNLDLVKLL